MTVRPQETACPRCCCIVPTRATCSHCGSPLSEPSAELDESADAAGLGEGPSMSAGEAKRRRSSRGRVM
jgi:hypothetical protein